MEGVWFKESFNRLGYCALFIKQCLFESVFSATIFPFAVIVIGAVPEFCCRVTVRLERQIVLAVVLTTL